MSDRPQPQNHPKKHIWLYRMIIAALGVTVIPTVVGAIILASFSESMPNAVAFQAARMSSAPGFQLVTHLNR